MARYAVGAVKQIVGRSFTDGGEQAVRGGLFEEDGAGTDAEGEEDDGAEAEGEGERGGADEDVFGPGAEDLGAVTVADGEHVAVEVHGSLGLSGGARGEGDEAGFVGAAGPGVEAGRGVRHGGEEVAGAVAAHGDQDGGGCGNGGGQLELAHQAVVGEREADLGLVEDIGDFLGAQQRHGGDGDAAGLDDGEVGGDHHGGVGRAEEDAGAGDEAMAGGEDVGDAVHSIVKVAVGPVDGAFRGAGPDAGPFSVSFLDP